MGLHRCVPAGRARTRRGRVLPPSPGVTRPSARTDAHAPGAAGSVLYSRGFCNGVSLSAQQIP
eukprot:5600232-Pleurochrysis_carterae.AAC.1